jgi:hypothetical protein
MKNLQEMKKAELQAVAEEEGVMYGAKTTVAELVSLIEKNRGNGKQTDAGTFKMLKAKVSDYKERADARVAKNFPTVSGELKIKREVEWHDERNERDETLIFFHVGSHPDECLIFSGALVAAANKAGIELLSETDDGVVMNDGFNVSLAPRKFAFDKAK